jgi:TolA-binding protein
MIEMALLQLNMKNKIKAKKYYQQAQELFPNITNAQLDKALE